MIILDPPDPATSWVRPRYFENMFAFAFTGPSEHFTLFSGLVGAGRALLKHVVFEMLSKCAIQGPCQDLS